MSDNIGNFNSSVGGTPAVRALGTNGAGGINASSDTGRGVVGVSDSHTGVEGNTTSGIAVYGSSTGPGSSGRGVVGVSDNNTAVEGQSIKGVAVYGSSQTGEAGHFDGNVTVTGDIVLTGADCAEEFDVSEVADVEPGTVMVLDQGGGLQQSQRAYDKRVAGVISGAGNYKPGLILDRQQSRDNRLPVALVGKVYCKVDAQYAPIEVGDLLTTSPTSGHAMKADDPFKAFGSVIGKALRPLEAGQGMIPILIALQ
jgi:hypothetical protein